MHFTGIEFATGSLRMLYMLYSCFTHALLMLYSCFTTGSLLGGILGDLAEAADYYRFSRLVN